MNKKTQVKRIFDSISNRYDLLNHLLSGGIDIYWRKKALRLSRINETSVLLDVACGTGDFAIEAKKLKVKTIIGADLSLNMLRIFNKKTNWSKGNIVQTVAEKVPFKNNSFTNITVAFGVRNFYDILESFRNFYRVLKPGGTVTILEFRLPKNKFVRSFYLFYFNKILPLIGRIISSDKEAYTYLPESVDAFDSKVDLWKLLNDAGFNKINNHPLTFGIVQVVVASKQFK